MTKKNLALLIMAGVFTLIGLALFVGAEADLKGEPVSHTGCLVTDKLVTPTSKNQLEEPYHYHIDSTCGKFLADEYVYDGITLGETYDLVTTAGKWTSKQILLSFTFSY